MLNRTGDVTEWESLRDGPPGYPRKSGSQLLSDSTKVPKVAQCNQSESSSSAKTPGIFARFFKLSHRWPFYVKFQRDLFNAYVHVANLDVANFVERVYNNVQHKASQKPKSFRRFAC